LSFSFLTETKIYSQKLTNKALKGFQALASPIGVMFAEIFLINDHQIMLSIRK
jgi:hypothetical protein